MEISQRLFGLHPNGTEIFAYEIANSQNISICVIDYGATLTSVKTPDRNGKLAEINLGFDSLEQYLAPHPYLGATIGRYANRIASGHFTIDFTEYRLTCNDNGINHIHGGAAGFDKQIWQGEMFEQQDKAGVLFTYLSVDGEEGYPGNLNVRVIYSLNEANELKIEYFARTDKITPVNLTNHAYWNLSGVGNNTVIIIYR
jgi:aldose 1-epimerase